uniref:Uncharacterized protein n=1 Tax=Anguilla anguilla TaxID=7936 RepID=A0A0E9RDZ8_ANGAN
MLQTVWCVHILRLKAGVQVHTRTASSMINKSSQCQCNSNSNS